MPATFRRQVWYGQWDFSAMACWARSEPDPETQLTRRPLEQRLDANFGAVAKGSPLFADQAGQHLDSPVKAGLRHSGMVVSNVSMSRFRGISRVPGLRHQKFIISTCLHRLCFSYQ